ncbi:hypothetical protein [Streptomyces sp. MZ04]|uniref:hypothetical protein n=1 Tax=Streptomyces sp. MZ04 TaxID=2559236 RepID=UPI00107EA1FF|nr:hypothetical protein [Streptomyces sp. MZ04]TGA94492.1 hypothetical protein E2651_35010 [Streptomyces sp. MZ04]
MAWLVQELGIQLSFFREHGARLVEIDAPSTAWADVVVEHAGKRWRVRVRLERRDEPIEYPGMNLAEMFGEGRHLALAEDGVIHGAL